MYNRYEIVSIHNRSDHTITQSRFPCLGPDVLWEHYGPTWVAGLF